MFVHACSRLFHLFVLYIQMCINVRLKKTKKKGKIKSASAEQMQTICFSVSSIGRCSLAPLFTTGHVKGFRKCARGAFSCSSSLPAADFSSAERPHGESPPQRSKTSQQAENLLQRLSSYTSGLTPSVSEMVTFPSPLSLFLMSRWGSQM